MDDIVKTVYIPATLFPPTPATQVPEIVVAIPQEILDDSETAIVADL